MLYFLCNQPIYGGDVFVNSNKYIDMNMKSERHYGWGNEHYDCYNRFTNLGNNVYSF